MNGDHGIAPSPEAPPAMRYVGVGRRFVALAIDSLIGGALVATFADYETGNGFRISWLGWRFAAFWLVPLAYFVLFEWLAGATPGKFAMGLRVRTTQGARIGFGASLGRNLARVIDALPYLIPYLMGAVAIARSPTCQRMGDRWANTVVIEREPGSAGPVPPGVAPAIPVPPPPTSPPAPLPPPPPTAPPRS